LKLITIHETENTLEAIDSLVKQRVFNSRAEVYRTGALLMITVESARKLAQANRLDDELYSRRVRGIIPLIRKGELDGAREDLTSVEEGLRLKAVLNRVGGKDSEGIETLADGFHRYAGALARASEMEPETRLRLIRDLTRDLRALLSQTPGGVRPPRTRKAGKGGTRLTQSQVPESTEKQAR